MDSLRAEEGEMFPLEMPDIRHVVDLNLAVYQPTEEPAAVVMD
jgi:hypothetical protein